MTSDLAKAVDLALGGHWEQAHGIVQQHEEDAMAAWIHAVLHKIEGDASNSRYWYRRAGKMECVAREPGEELRQIKLDLDAAP